MSMSLEELWKAADDDKIIEAIGRWESTNEIGQRTLLAEVKRRGLKVEVPEITARPVQSAPAAPSSFPPKAMMVVAVIVAIGIAFVVLAR